MVSRHCFNDFPRCMGPGVRRDDVLEACYFPLLVNFFTATRNSSVCMAVDDLLFFGVELLLGSA